MTVAPEGLTLVDGPSLVAGVSALLRRYTDRAEFTVQYIDDGGGSRAVLTLDDAQTFPELVARVTDALAATPTEWDGSEPDAVVALGQAPPSGTPHAPWLIAWPDGEQLQLELRRNGSPGMAGIADDLFIGHLRTLLAAAVREPATPLAALPVLSEPERHRLLVDWNDTACPYPRVCLPELFHAQVAATPDAIAVEFQGDRLSYAELDARANRLAHHLVGLGVGPETLVGICVERSLDMVVGLLGILKAGGAYVPIDPGYPAERQEYMLENSQAAVVVTQKALRDTLPVGDAAVVCIDADWIDISQMPCDAPAGRRDPEDLAYVIYTSGSTGAPKGVQIPHRALVNFLVAMRRAPGLTAGDVLVAVTTLSFDIAGLELYLPLITGARVVLAPAATSGDPRALAGLLEASGATVMQATPTTWRMLVDSGWSPVGGLKGLCGGEALPVALADQLVGVGVELWNMYGPTETTIWSTCARIATRGEPLTIGRPIANTTLHILDRRMQPVPVGVPGELWIGGEGLARGYRGRSDLTDERFVPNPFDASPGARIYRTGDLARYRPDGTVAFLGRIDQQVKVRGFRIELGEIEAVAARHPGIADAVVVARGSDADAELAAYVIPVAAAVPARELRQFLAKTVPAYMVPSTVTTLEAFPLTPNGKVDRKALPEPTRERSDDRELVVPRTALEQRLAAIWERQLGISPIGVTDDFFDLGASSIVAATLFAEIEHELGDALPLGAIFRAPTIESLARLLEAGPGTSRWKSLVPIQPEGTQPPIFCIHGGAGTILHLQELARRLGDDQPFYGLQSLGLYGGDAPVRTVERMATQYLAEMREVQPHGPWRLTGYCFGALVAFELAQRLVAEGDEVQLVAMFNGPSPGWIRRCGWYGNQPGWRAQRSLPPPPSEDVRRARRRKRKLTVLMTVIGRVPRAIVQPRRLVTGLLWYTKSPRIRLLLALGRPVPERDRELFFLELHQKAERAYAPSPYPGEILVFYGSGLYEEPAMGWDVLTTGGVLPFAVPGEHTNNRQLMHAPAASFVADRLREYLARND